jgi:hypothetical protein
MKNSGKGLVEYSLDMDTCGNGISLVLSSLLFT